MTTSSVTKLHNVPELQGLLPFVWSIYARPTTYIWEDSEGLKHRIVQAEGGEQGDPLMPLLFSLGIHDSLCAVKEQLRPADELFACLDDVHVASPPNRIREAYNLEAERPPAFSLRRRLLQRAPWMHHKPRVHSGGSSVSHF